MEKLRKIIHVDMDAFYAAIEQRDNPNLQGKPVCVGGKPDGRGVVTTCSYEARVFGIHSAMASSRAYRLCPKAIFVPPRFEAYKAASDHIRKIFYEYTDLVEPRSLDEAYLDVTENKKGILSSKEIAQMILEQIKSELNLTASAGVSFNKFLAKVGSDFKKPNGITVIPLSEADEFIDKLPIRKFIGVGKKTEIKMKEMGIETGADLKKYSIDELRKVFGKSGNYFYNMAYALDERAVHITHGRKSIGSQRTFHEDIQDPQELIKKLEHIADRISKTMKRYEIKGKTVTLKVRYQNYTQVSRSQTLRAAVNDYNIIIMIVENLMQKTDLGKKKVRLVGISISNLVNQSDVKCVQSILPFDI
jgi:DNA polymerase-4